MAVRRESRFKKQLLVSLNVNGGDQIGVTSNVSKGGMALSINEIVEEGDSLVIQIAQEDRVYNASGTAKWVKDLSFGNTFSELYGVGIQISAVDRGYIDYIDQMGDAFEIAIDPRFAN